MALPKNVKTRGSIVTTGEFTVGRVQSVVDDILKNSGTAADIQKLVINKLPVQELKKILDSETALGKLFRTLTDGDPSISLDITGNKKSFIAKRFSELASETENKELKPVYTRISENFDILNSAERRFAAKVPTSRTKLEALLDTRSNALNKFLNSRQDIQARTTADISLFKSTFDIGLSVSRNAQKASLLDELGRELDEKTLDILTAKFVADDVLWERVGTSPSILERILFSIQNIIKGTPTKDIPNSASFVSKTKGKTAFTRTERALVKKAARARKKLKEILVRYKTKIRDKTLESDFSLISLINANLHDAIQSNMRESTDPPNKRYLRYQTGTFARSAKVLNIVRTKNSANVFYDYLRDPYEVYTQGHLPFTLRGRDVEHIISKSIKDIAIGRLNKRFKINTEAI